MSWACSVTLAMVVNISEPLLQVPLISKGSTAHEILRSRLHGGVLTSCSQGDDEDDHENANILIRNPKWIDLKTQRYGSGTI